MRTEFCLICTHLIFRTFFFNEMSADSPSAKVLPLTVATAPLPPNNIPSSLSRGSPSGILRGEIAGQWPGLSGLCSIFRLKNTIFRE
jgi:hypothetical protein